MHRRPWSASLLAPAVLAITAVVIPIAPELRGRTDPLVSVDGLTESVGPSVLVSTAGRDPQLAIVKGHVYVANGNQIDIVDISDPRAPRLVTRTPLGDGISGLSTDGEFLFVSTPHWIYRLSLTDPVHPIESGTYTPRDAVVEHIFGARKGVLWLSASTCSMPPVCSMWIEAVTFAASDEPRLVYSGMGQSNTATNWRSAYVQGDFLFLPWGEGGLGWSRGFLKIFDIADPQLTNLWGQYPEDAGTGVHYGSPLLHGDWLYVVRSELRGIATITRLDIVRLAQPTPRLVADRPDLDRFLAADDDRAWMPMGDQLVVIDLSSPAQPVRRGAVRPQLTISTLVADGPLAWLLEEGGWRRLIAVDASDMARPVQVAELPMVERSESWVRQYFPSLVR